MNDTIGAVENWRVANNKTTRRRTETVNNTIQNGSINPESGVARHFADRGLSPTEARVLELFADGRYTSKDIASELGCSPSTVDKHMRSICLKTGATGRVSLMQRIADRRTGAR